jgi:hypothetical protein
MITLGKVSAWAFAKLKNQVERANVINIFEAVATTFSKTTLSITTFSITILNIMDLFATLSIINS